MSPRSGEKLIAAWVPAQFAASVDALADTAALSRSELIRAALVRTALRLARERDERTNADR